jgi:hypothetical protein
MSCSLCKKLLMRLLMSVENRFAAMQPPCAGNIRAVARGEPVSNRLDGQLEAGRQEKRGRNIAVPATNTFNQLKV